jgi:hypothetical protein
MEVIPHGPAPALSMFLASLFVGVLCVIQPLIFISSAAVVAVLSQVADFIAVFLFLTGWAIMPLATLLSSGTLSRAVTKSVTSDSIAAGVPLFGYTVPSAGRYPLPWKSTIVIGMKISTMTDGESIGEFKVLFTSFSIFPIFLPLWPSTKLPSCPLLLRNPSIFHPDQQY